MASNTDDVDDEYLDDPISLIAIDNIKTEICDEDQTIHINSSSDEEEIYTSAYGKKNLVLPVTFFDNTRNLRLLNKCKPMSINIVDCKQYPTYYIKSEEKMNSKSDESRVEIDTKEKSDSENKPKSADVQNVVVNSSITVAEADSKQKGKKKRHVSRKHCHSFYEKLKRRKENSKQTALNCKDLSQVDFKRNTGLVGLKLTDTTFKKNVDTENIMIRTKKDPAKNISKESNENGAEKQLITEKKDKFNENFTKSFKCVVENALSMIFGNKSKENKKSDTEKEPVVAKSTDYTKERSENALDKSFVENQCKNITEKDGEKTLSRTNIASAKDKSKENCESNTYIKQVGVTLDDLGTTIIPVTDTHTNYVVSNNATVIQNIENKSIKTHDNSAAFIDTLGYNRDIAMRCSLKIPSKEIVEKLKLKEVKSHCKSALDISQNTIVQKSITETMNKSQTVPKFNIKSYKGNRDGSFVISKKDKLECKSLDKHVACSRETQQVEKPMAKDASEKYQPGPNSPVLPCTTFTVRAGPPKSSQNIPSTKDTAQYLKQYSSSTSHTTPPAKSRKHSLPLLNIDKPRSTSNDAKKLSQSSKISMLSQANQSSDCKYTDTSKQLPVVTQTNVRATADTKASSVCTQNSTSNIKSLNITEYKPPSCYPFAVRQIDIKNSIPAPNLTDQNMSKTNLTKETNQVNTPIKSASFSGNAPQINNQTTNVLMRNLTYPYPQMSPSPAPKFSGHNAIIFRRPPPPPWRVSPNHAPPNRGQHIPTLINHRPQYQPMPHGSTPMTFRLPPPLPPPPPNYPAPPPNYSSPPSKLAQIRSNQIFIPPSRMRGVETGVSNWWIPGPRPPGCRPPLPIPPVQDYLQMDLRPPTPQVNKDSVIGNNANGDPIKKIIIPPLPQMTDTVNDKQMMLEELNNAMMSPDLTANNPEEKPTGDLKREADPKLTEPVKPKYSKPCPLSKKSSVATDLNIKVPDNPVPKVWYSPPILPIWTYEESFQMFSKIDTNIKKGVPNNDPQNRTPSKTKFRANIIKLGSKKQKRTHTDSGKQDKAKKISFEDYRKRSKDGADRIDVDKIRRHNKSKNVNDDYNQDLGYDSDSTVKL